MEKASITLLGEVRLIFNRGWRRGGEMNGQNKQSWYSAELHRFMASGKLF